jgi:hypothetical protein
MKLRESYFGFEFIMWVGMKSTDVSESYIASIFRIEE